MSHSRLTPFDLVFADVASKVFPHIRSALQQAGNDPRDRDAFLMLREVITLLRELRPDEGLGEGIDQLAALVHHSYLFWEAGNPTVELPIDQLRVLLGDSVQLREEYQHPPTYYVQLPERRLWGETVVGEPPEPMDGCFVHAWPDEMSLRVLGVFGVRADRAGFTVVEVMGPRPATLVRQNRSALFSPSLPGGAAAGLFSIAGGEELLELGWRTRTLLVPSATEAGRWRA